MVFIGEESGKNDSQLDLEQLIAGIEDVTDPSSIDKILEYVEKNQEKDEKFIQLLIQRLQNAVIYWEQPWYQKDHCLSRPHKFTADNETIAYRTDTVSHEEHAVIARNWRKFRKKYNLPDQLISLVRWKNKGRPRNHKICVEEQARRYAIAYLARGLERNTYQVYQHISKYYGGYRKGYYSHTEEKIIEICFHHKPRLVAKILSIVLGREPRMIYTKLGYLINGKPDKKRLKWTLPLASKLLQCLLKYSELELEELKNRKFEKWVWSKLGEEFNHHDCYLQHFWYCYLHVQLFVRSDVKLSKLRKKLLKKLRSKARDSTYKVWSDIRWKDITLEFPDGFTPRFLYRLCYVCISSFKGYLTIPLEDVVDYGLQKLKSEKGHNKRLRTLKLNKDGLLERVDYRSTQNSTTSE